MSIEDIALPASALRGSEEQANAMRRQLERQANAYRLSSASNSLSSIEGAGRPDNGAAGSSAEVVSSAPPGSLATVDSNDASTPSTAERGGAAEQAEPSAEPAQPLAEPAQPSAESAEQSADGRVPSCAKESGGREGNEGSCNESTPSGSAELAPPELGSAPSDSAELASAASADTAEGDPSAPSASSAEAVASAEEGHKAENVPSNEDASSADDVSSVSSDQPEPPEEFICPLSLDIMFDPVIVESGQTYERAFIERWVADGHKTCPKTRQPLPSGAIIPNQILRALISDWCKRNRVAPPNPISADDVALAFSAGGAKGAEAGAGGLAAQRRREYAAAAVRAAAVAVESERRQRALMEQVMADRAAAAARADGRAGDRAGADELATRQARIQQMRAAAAGQGQGRGVGNAGADARGTAPGAAAGTGRGGGEERGGQAGAGGDMRGMAERTARVSAGASAGAPAPAEPPSRTAAARVAARTAARDEAEDRYGNGIPDHLLAGLGGGSGGAPSYASSSHAPASSSSLTPSEPPEEFQMLDVDNLVNHMRTGPPEEKAAAAALLRVMTRHGFACGRRVLEAGGVAPLVDLLWSDDEPTAEHATTSLFNLALEASARMRIVVTTGSRVVEGLVHVLSAGAPAARANAAAALFLLSRDTGANSSINSGARAAAEANSFREAVVTAGALQPLLDLLLDGPTRAKKDAANLLVSLCMARPNRSSVAKAGAVRCLCQLLSEGVEVVEEQAAAVFAALVRDPEGREVLVEEGAVPALAELVEGGTQGRAREYAVGTLLGLGASSKEWLVAIDEEGISASVDVLTRVGTGKTQAKGRAREYAVGTLLGLGASSREWLVVIDEEGISASVDVLIRTERVRDPEGREVLVEEGAVPALAELVDGGTQGRAREYAVGTLLGLGASSKEWLVAIDEEGISASVDVLTRVGTGKTQAKVSRVKAREWETQVARLASHGAREYAVGTLLGLGASNREWLVAIDEEGNSASVDVLTRVRTDKTQAKTLSLLLAPSPPPSHVNPPRSPHVTHHPRLPAAAPSPSCVSPSGGSSAWASATVPGTGGLERESRSTAGATAVMPGPGGLEGSGGVASGGGGAGLIDMGWWSEGGAIASAGATQVVPGTGGLVGG
ncbi:unnamed protein product [Closterium sp. Naga37s-1]|nr:unnamed protein product [Closterium sp. Naga37s-1]